MKSCVGRRGAQLWRCWPVLMLMACTTGQQQGAGAITGPDTCGAAPHSALIGRDVRAIDAGTLPANRRIIFTTSASSGRNDPARLTIEVNSSGRVTAVRCG